MGKIIKWRNFYSGEEGYVAKVSTKELCFYNTLDINSAKVYSSEAIAKKTLRQLESFGQGSAICNEFSIITV